VPWITALLELPDHVIGDGVVLTLGKALLQPANDFAGAYQGIGSGSDSLALFV
jgi:hypothetical protein